MEGGGVEEHLSPVDEPISDHHSDESPPRHHSDQLPATVTPVLTDELRDKIIKQVEYYLSDENLINDKFLLKYLAKDEQGYIPVGVIASFRKMKKLTTHKSLVVAALKESSILTLSKNQKKVKRVHPFPLTEVLDPENLPEDHTIENMKTIFGVAGIIKKITIHEGNATRDAKKCSTEEKLLSGKLHAVVEYQTVEAAENAAATLNNEQDWRNGMRVKLLKRRVKNAQRKKGHDSEKRSSVHADSLGDKESKQSSEHHDAMPNEEHELHTGEHHSKEKNGDRGQHRMRSRRQKYQGSSGTGHGTAYHTHGGEMSKPPPGPRMPDGTRGFTMGRGRPLS
uniref:La-related protein 6A n=1 Tax=Tanacetum cinerariifolium TaxID=118510 RepID=A0A6L2M3M8_TANCI|nr:la-related protein 6A [Tanacetum cinerariifolium]